MTIKNWTNDGYQISERDFDHDLHVFEVSNSLGVYLGTIYPDTLDEQEEIVEALDRGESPEGWEDGLGNIIFA